jgi:hypothetical protein
MKPLRETLARLIVISLFTCDGDSGNGPSEPEAFNPFYRDHMR